ncbi:MAG TPA: hypothetical protein VLB46_12785 [Pyrinomonadaceae bacterium]|nr:hypothetical protein [Pyrinomonadaceae bacterium]
MKDLFIIVLTLVALCFSVGEGLRLTPFPVPATDSSVTEASQLSVHQYGPLNVPAQAQKRSKRFAIDLSCPVSLYTHESLALRHSASEDHPSTVAAVLAVAFPSDRAPPFSI